MRHVMQHPGDQALADNEHNGDERHDFGDGQRRGCGYAGKTRRASAFTAERTDKGRQ